MLDFKAKKCTKFKPQTPLGELTALPQTDSWIKGGLLLRGRGRVEGKEGEGKGRKKVGRG